MRVFDFDNTIYDGESGFDIFLYFLRKEPKLIAKYVPKFGEGFIRYKMGKVTIDDVKNEYSYILKECCAQFSDIPKDIEIFWDEHEKKIKSFYAKIQHEDDVTFSPRPEVVPSHNRRGHGI